MRLVWLKGDQVVDTSTVILAMDWDRAKESSYNKEMASYARAHGFLVDKNLGTGVLLLTSEKMYLLPGSLKSIKKTFSQT